jgi:hypothetical protein
MNVDMKDLSKAIVLFLQYGSARSPRSDVESVIAEFGRTGGLSILAHVHSVIEELNSIKVDWQVYSLVSAGKMVRGEMHKRYPELSEDALNALEWKFTFDWR